MPTSIRSLSIREVIEVPRVLVEDVNETSSRYCLESPNLNSLLLLEKIFPALDEIVSSRSFIAVLYESSSSLGTL